MKHTLRKSNTSSLRAPPVLLIAVDVNADKHTGVHADSMAGSRAGMVWW